MTRGRYVQSFLLSCVLFFWFGTVSALPQGEKTEKKEPVPEGKVNIEEKVSKKAELVYMVKPVYPAEAKQKGIEGTVRIDAIVSEKGEVTKATALSGSELLREAALAAVRQWRYKPLGVAFKTTITVNYTLAPKTEAEKPKS